MKMPLLNVPSGGQGIMSRSKVKRVHFWKKIRYSFWAVLSKSENSQIGDK